MKREPFSFFLRFVFIVTLLSGIGWAQQNQQMVIKEIQTDIQNPTGIITIDEPSDKSSPVRQIIRTEQELLFCDENFKVINRRPINKSTKITCSKKTQYFLLDDFTYDSKKYVVSRNLVFIDNNGKELWSRTGIIENEDAEINYYPLDNHGNIFKIDHNSSTVTIISRDGIVINKIELFKDLEYSRGRRLYIDISETGEYLVILTEKYPSHMKSTGRPNGIKSTEESDSRQNVASNITEKIVGEPTLFLINYKGELLKRLQVLGDQPSNVFINDDGSLIFYAVANLDISNVKYTISLIDSNFNELFSSSILGLPKSLLFKSNFIIIGYWDNLNKNYKLSALDKNTGSIFWSNELKYTPVGLFDVDNQIFNLLSCSPVSAENSNDYYWIDIFNTQGVKLQQLEIGEIKNEYIFTSKPYMYRQNKYLINNNRIKIIDIKR